MEDKKVYYSGNADSDPTNLDQKGYFKKHKNRLESESGISYKERSTPYHVPQFDLIEFLDKECRTRMNFDDKKSGYYHLYYIRLSELKRKAKNSVFLSILLEAYLNNDLAEQIDKHYFCS